jgi:hypothetical protein
MNVLGRNKRHLSIIKLFQKSHKDDLRTYFVIWKDFE